MWLLINSRPTKCNYSVAIINKSWWLKWFTILIYVKLYFYFYRLSLKPWLLNSDSRFWIRLAILFFVRMFLLQSFASITRIVSVETKFCDDEESIIFKSLSIISSPFNSHLKIFKISINRSNVNQSISNVYFTLNNLSELALEFHSVDNRKCKPMQLYKFYLRFQLNTYLKMDPHLPWII